MSKWSDIILHGTHEEKADEDDDRKGTVQTSVLGWGKRN